VTSPPASLSFGVTQGTLLRNAGRILPIHQTFTPGGSITPGESPTPLGRSLPQMANRDWLDTQLPRNQGQETRVSFLHNERRMRRGRVQIDIGKVAVPGKALEVWQGL